MRKSEIFIDSLWLIISIIAYRIASTFPRIPFVKTGPAFWPKIVLIIMIFCSAYLLIKSLIQYKNQTTENAREAKTERLIETGQKFWGTIFFTILYIVLLKFIGFVILTPIYLTTLFNFFSPEKQFNSKFIILSIVIGLVLTIIFPKIMLIPLSRGQGIFREMSLFFY